MSENIEGFFAGDDLDIQRDITGITVTDPLVKAWLTIKPTGQTVDASATVQKIITTTLVSGVGQIAQTGGTGSGNGTASVLFQLTKTDTGLIGSVLHYFWDIQVKTASGGIYTAVTGFLKFERGYTDAVT